MYSYSKHKICIKGFCRNDNISDLNKHLVLIKCCIYALTNGAITTLILDIFFHCLQIIFNVLLL